MKKIVFFFMITFLFAVSACGPAEDSDSIIEISGVLSKNDSREFPGTHLISDDALNITPVSSVSINLSEPAYLNNKVRLIGKKNPDSGIFTVSGISVLEVLSNGADTLPPEPKEYMNSDFGFRLIINSDWEIDETDSSITFISPSYEVNAVEAFDRVVLSQFAFSYDSSPFDNEQQDSPLLNYMATEFPEINDPSPYMAKVGVDQIEAVKLDNPQGGTDYFMYRNGLIYRLSFLPFDPFFKSEYELAFNKIVSEFRFVGFTQNDSGDFGDFTEEPFSEDEISEQAPAEGIFWTDPENYSYTYFESLPYSFKAKYPSSWYYAGTLSGDVEALHHYGFSTEPVSAENEIIALDIIKNIPDGNSITVNGIALIERSENLDTSFYLSAANRNFRVSGPVDYRDLLIAMAMSIEQIQVD